MTSLAVAERTPDRQVILIDDEAMFAARDYEVRAFDSAAGFLEDLPNLSPACIVTDLRMPGMNGVSLLDRLKGEVGMSWPVIIISGHAGSFDVAAAKQAGAADLLIKPFAPQQLLAMVESALAGDGGDDARAQTDGACPTAGSGI